MTGMAITWNKDEIQVIDEGDFEKKVVDIIDGFFQDIDEYSAVTVEWKTEKRDHDCVYKVSQEPLVHLDRSRCFIDITGQQKGGEYKIDLNPSSFEIETRSTGHKEDLTFLQLRPEGIAMDPEEEEIFLNGIPEEIKDKIVKKFPTG